MIQKSEVFKNKRGDIILAQPMGFGVFFDGSTAIVEPMLYISERIIEGNFKFMRLLEHKVQSATGKHHGAGHP